MASQQNHPTSSADRRAWSTRISARLTVAIRKSKTRLESTAYANLNVEGQSAVWDAVNSDLRAQLESIVPHLGAGEYIPYDSIVESAITNAFNSYIHLFRYEGEDHPTVEELVNRTA
ncbi:uncharacterized protein PG986_013701 [Apiospora aurea]|uniref:Uncharacterized protein n=1 Tax=Apiospora aurea TaxID=335848 RepID=A0ABR1PWM8_9PEZI